MNLCVIILTSNLEDQDKPPKFMPKVCYQVGGKSMLEICLENVIRLNPKRIILMVSKNHILYINKVLKYTSYSRLISYSIFQKERRIETSMACYDGKDVLVIPANAPLLSFTSLLKIVYERRNVKITNNIFYLKKDSLNKIGKISEMKSEDLIPEKETEQIETKEQLEEICKQFEKKSFKK